MFPHCQNMKVGTAVAQESWVGLHLKVTKGFSNVGTVHMLLFLSASKMDACGENALCGRREISTVSPPKPFCEAMMMKLQFL